MPDRVRNKRNRILFGEWLYGYLFAAPIILGTLVFSIAPIFVSLYMSLTRWDGLSMSEFIGFKNFVDMLHNRLVYREFINTLYYTAGAVPITLLLSLFIANLIYGRTRGQNVLRILFFLPNVTMPAAIAIVWQWIFNSKVGLLNQILKIFGITGPKWLADVRFIMPAIIIVAIWGGIGYSILIFMAGLHNIPKNYYEAADIDGASGYHKFFKITFPLISPTIFFLLTMSIIASLKVFDIIFIFLGAGSAAAGLSTPYTDATRSMVYGIFQEAFTFGHMGLASAEAVLLFAIIMIVTFFQFQLQKKWVFYE
jgi:multiple sugar transport system permease protein